jgi:hypothetical protein
MQTTRWLPAPWVTPSRPRAIDWQLPRRSLPLTASDLARMARTAGRRCSTSSSVCAAAWTSGGPIRLANQRRSPSMPDCHGSEFETSTQGAFFSTATPDWRVLHAAHCSAVARMNTKTEKYLGKSVSEARAWANGKNGVTGWKTCDWKCLEGVRRCRPSIPRIAATSAEAAWPWAADGPPAGERRGGVAGEADLPPAGRSAAARTCSAGEGEGVVVQTQSR